MWDGVYYCSTKNWVRVGCRLGLRAHQKLWNVCLHDGEKFFFEAIYNKHLLSGLSEHTVAYLNCKGCLADSRLPEYGQEARQSQAIGKDALCCEGKSL